MTVERIHRVQDDLASFVSFRVTPDEIRKGDLVQDGSGEWCEVVWPRRMDTGDWRALMTSGRDFIFGADIELEVRRSKGSA